MISMSRITTTTMVSVACAAQQDLDPRPICPECGEHFLPNRPDQRFCIKQHRKNFHRRGGPKPGIRKKRGE